MVSVQSTLLSPPNQICLPEHFPRVGPPPSFENGCVARLMRIAAFLHPEQLTRTSFRSPLAPASSIHPMKRRQSVCSRWIKWNHSMSST